MKKINIIISAFICFLVSSCSSNIDEPIITTEPNEISFYIDFKFDDGGSMSRANSDVYNSFYEEKIKTKILTPDGYSLRFTNKQTKITYEFNGKWSNNDAITLIEGEYTVTGTSNASGEYIQEKVSLEFSQDITVTKDIYNISLSAKYNCFLLFFNKSNLNEISYTRESSTSAPNTKIDLTYEYNRYYYIFSSNLDTGYFYGKRENGSSFKLRDSSFPFEEGKYYFFNDISNSFDIPKMESGN